MSGLQGLRVWKVWSFLGLSMTLVVAMFMFQVETVLPGAPDVCEEPCEDEAMLPRNPAPVPDLEPFEAAVPEPPTVPVDADVPAGDSSTATSQVQEVQQLSVTTEPPASVDGPDSAAVEVQLPVEIPLGKLFKESAARREAAKREKATAQAEAAGPLVSDELSRSAVITPQPPAPRLLPLRLIVPAPRGSILVARGAMGYRVPLVVKQEVPDQIQDGVYIPAHEAYVVLRPGYWDPEGPNEGLTETEPEDGVVEASGDVVKQKSKRPNWLQRLFRRKGRGADSGS